MTRICAYPACHTGSRKTYKTINCRNKSLFKFPKKELPQRKQWEEVIGRAARDHEVLCEDHFSSDKIIRDFKIVLPNGRVDVIERGVIRLQPDAVPLLPDPLPEHNYAKIDADENVVQLQNIKQENEDTVDNAEHQNSINDIQQNIVLNNLKNVDINQKIVNNIPALIQIDKQHPPPLIWRLPVDNNSNTKVSSAAITPMTSSLTIVIAKELTPPTKIINKQNELTTPVATVPVPVPATATAPAPAPVPATVPVPVPAPITIKTPTTITPITMTTANSSKRFSNKKIEKIKIIDKPEVWDLDKLYNELTIVYDDKIKWGVIRLENKLSIIVFDNLIHPKKQMIVFFDLTYEVRINCRKVFVPGLKENTTIDNVLHNIRVLHKLVPCDGPGGGESPAFSCSGYASVDGSNIRYGHLRCQSCNDLRKKILRKRAYDIKVDKRLHDKIKSLRRTVKLTKAKLKRVKTRYGNKKDIDELLNTEESDDDDLLNIDNN